MMKLSVIIVTYNSIDHIFECIDSIYKYQDIEDDCFEIIIVDNNSSEQLQMFSELKDRYTNRTIRLIANKNNDGYGQANNIGVQHSKYDNILILNPDVRIIEPVFAKLLSALNKDNIGMVGVNFTKGLLPFFFKPEYVTFWNQIFIKCYVKNLRFVEKRMFVTGSFIGFNRKAFIECGQFDSNIFLYCEEADISNRILAKDWNICFVKDIMVLHLAHNRSFNPQMAKIYLNSILYYLRKYNFSTKKYLTSQIRVFKVKYLISKLIRNIDKETYFNGWIQLIKNELKK